MKTLPALAAVALLACLARAQEPDYLNRLATTVSYDGSTAATQIVFIDAETGETAKHFLPPGLRPASLVAMDKRGDVWIDEMGSFLLYKISAADGSVLAVVNPGRRATYMVTDRNGSLVVGSANTLTGPQAAAYIDRYTSDGVYIDGVDLRTLFPPGLLAPLINASPTAPPTYFYGGIPRIVITRSGCLWVGVLNSKFNPVIRLTPDLKLAGSYGLYPPLAMVPDDNEGVWVFHNSGGVASQYPLNAPPMPGLPIRGWVHLSATGHVLYFNNDGLAAGNNVTPSFGHRRYDGRQFQFPQPGLVGSGYIGVSKPGNPPNPWFVWADRVDLQASNFQMYNYPYPYMSGFFLDGAQRIWALRNSYAGGVANWSIKHWTRCPVEPPYGNALGVEIGPACLHIPGGPTTWYWSTYWGNASLFEYVHYTDPYGDLDGDGIMNYVELANFSNPLLPYGFSPAASATGSGGAPGTAFTVDYSVPGDQGLSYAAPFALVQPHIEPLGGGFFLPVSLADPLVQLSLQPGAAGLSGTLGVLDAQGGATASIQVPPVPALSGLPFASCIVTRDPNLPLLFKTVSRPFHFTIP